MPKGRTSYLAIAAVFLFLETAAIVLLSKSSALHDIWLNRLSHRVMAATWSETDKLRNYLSLSRQNGQLAQENFELREELRVYKELVNRDYAAQMSSTIDSLSRFTFIPAKIVNLSVNSQHNHFAIDKGSLDGVVPYSGVVTGNGVVGIIDAVDKHYAYGRTLMNSNISVSARIGRDGIVSTLEWDGLRSDGALFKNIAIHNEVEPGDTLWTSGHSRYFPSDIPIGIATERRLVDGAVTEVCVTLFQDFKALRYVTVTAMRYPEETENFEK